MELQRIVGYRGSNVWSCLPVIELSVAFGPHVSFRTDRESEFVTRLLNLLPDLGDLRQHRFNHSAGVDAFDESKSFLSLLASGTNLAIVLEYVIRVLSTLTGTKPEYSWTESTSSPDQFLVLFHYEEEALSNAVIQTAMRLIDSAMDGTHFDINLEVRKLIDLADDVRLGPSTRSMTDAARVRGIPSMRLNSGSLVQLGEGVRKRRIWTTESDATSAIAESIASDKDLSKRLLHMAGVPVPAGRVVSSAEDAWDAANEIGFPVVVKPRDANHGRGISFDLTEKGQIVEAYELALGESPNVMVEQFASGMHHRFLVIGNKLVAAAKGQSEYVVGDGKRTIRELVDEVNRDPRRGENYTDSLGVLYLNKLALMQLKRQSHTPDTIPADQEHVLVKLNGDLTTDVTANVHPEVAAKAILAAQVIGLDIAGLDMVMTDVSRPLEEQRGMLIEVNSCPGLAHHISPLYGQPQPVGEAIIEMLFPNDHNGRIPIVAVTGNRIRSKVLDSIEKIMKDQFECLGIASEVGIYAGSDRLGCDSLTGTEKFQSLLMHPSVDAIVFESQPDQAAQFGFGHLRSDVVIVSDIPGDSSEMCGIIAAVRSVSRAGAIVLPEAALTVKSLMRACASEIILYGVEGCSIAIKKHLDNGGKGVFGQSDSIVFSSGKAQFERSYSDLDISNEIPLAIALPALAAAWALGIIGRKV